MKINEIMESITASGFATFAHNMTAKEGPIKRASPISKKKKKKKTNENFEVGASVVHKGESSTGGTFEVVAVNSDGTIDIKDSKGKLIKKVNASSFLPAGQKPVGVDY